MKLVYIVSMFIILLIALISPRKEYFNQSDQCYKNIGNMNSDGSKIIFNSTMLDNIFSKDSQIIEGDSYNDEITTNLRDLDKQQKIAYLDVYEKEASTKATKEGNNSFFDKQVENQNSMIDNILATKAETDNKLQISERNITDFVNKKIIEDTEAKLSNSVQDILSKNINSISLQLSKGEYVNNYNFNSLDMINNKFDSRIDNSNIDKTDKIVVPIKSLKPNGCYTQNDFDSIQQWTTNRSTGDCENYGISEIDYWKKNWNNFAVITSLAIRGQLPFATLYGKDVWHVKTFKEKSEAEEHVNNYTKTIFDWKSYSGLDGSFPVRVNPITTNIECLEKDRRCDTSFGKDMSKIKNNANTIKCKFDGTDPEWCQKVYTDLAKSNINSLYYNTCPKGWSLIDYNKNICKAPDTPRYNNPKCLNYKPIRNEPKCNNLNCKKIRRNEIKQLIDNCEAHFDFKPNPNAIINHQVVIGESVDNMVKDVLGTSTKPISSNIDRFNFYKKGILVKVYEAVKSNGIIVKGPAVGPRNHGEGNSVYIVNNINFADSSIILNTQFSEYPNNETKQVFLEFMGFIKIPENTEKITFQIESYQGSRLYFKIGDELINVIDSWNNSEKKQSRVLNVRPSNFYSFKLEYFLDVGISNLKLSWKLNNENNFTIISRDNFFLDTEQCNKLTNMPI